MFRICLFLSACALACGGAKESDPPPDAEPCEGDVVDASCCAPGTLHVEGVCQPAGVLPENCAEGFAPDGAMGCEPLLPAAPCPPGQMAIPGEIACRPVAPCGAGPWGDIPVTATSEHVLAGAGGTPDGSAAAPWPTIQQAVDAAAPGATIAIGAGSYAESVVVTNKQLVFWGKCPAEAEVVGGNEPALMITGGGEVHDLAVRGAAWGVAASGGTVVLDRLWVHDTGDDGVIVVDDAGETHGELSRSLIEKAPHTVVELLGATLVVRESEVRDGVDGPGDYVGRGVRAWHGTAGTIPDLTVERSVIRNNVVAGIAFIGATGRVDATAVIGTQPGSDGNSGQGIGVFMHEGVPAQATVTRSLVAASHTVGIHGVGADLVIDDTVVRDTFPRALDQETGRGVDVDDDVDTLRRSTLVINRSKLERNHDIGLLVMGSDATITSLLVRDTLPNVESYGGGIGIDVQLGVTSAQPASATIRGAAVERSNGFGLLVVSSTATIEQTAVRETSASYGIFGDGVALTSPTTPTDAHISGLISEANARGGLIIFGARLNLAASTLECNLLDLVGADHNTSTPELVDGGGNVCGCGGAESTCKLASAEVEIPEAPVQ